MVLPDYAGASIVNLMRSLGDSCGAPPTPYPPLRDFDTSMLAHAPTIVVLVVDGLGYRYLNTVGEKSALREHLWTRLTSVCPSTTASAITTLMTGVAPQQHGLTGWHMYLRELDTIAAILPLTPRVGTAFDDVPSLPSRLFSARPFADSIERKAYVVSPKAICDSPFNVYHSGRATRIPYDQPDDLFRAIEDIIHRDRQRKFIYAYYPELDAIAHRKGIASAEAGAVFNAFDYVFSRFHARVLDTDTCIVATADHGFVDSPPERLIEIDVHPTFADTLARPLCGERRLAYCYVKDDRRALFEDYVRNVFGAAAELYPSSELLRQGWFGSGVPEPRLAERIGDYALVMNDNWTIKDWLPGEKRHQHIGVHGGTSEDEMYVPLIVTLA